MTNLKANKKVIRGTGDSHPPVEDVLFFYGGSDLDEQIDQLVDTNNSPKINFAEMMNQKLKEVMKMISSMILLATLVLWKNSFTNREKIG